MSLILKSTLNKHALSLMMAISFSFFSMPTIGMDAAEGENPSAIQPTPQRVLTPKEALEDSARLFNLCNAGKYEEALKKAFPEPTIAVETRLIEGKQVSMGFTMGNMEQYNFFRLCSLSMIYTHMGNNEQLNPAKAALYYHISSQYIATYLSSPVFGPSFISDYTSVNDLMNTHRALAYKKASEASSQWARLLIKPNMCNADKILTKELLFSSINSLKKSIQYLEITPGINTLENILHYKFGLFNEYVTFISFSDTAEGGEYLKEAKKIRQEFQNYAYYKAKTAQALKFLELKQERDFLLVKNEGSRKVQVKEGSRKVQELRKKNVNKQTVIFSEMFADITVGPNNKNDPSSLQVEVSQDHDRLFCLARNDVKDLAIVPLLKKIEGKIHEKLINSNAPSSLYEVYQKYEIFLGGNTLREHIVSHILPAFLFTGDIEGALERVIILAQLEHNKQGNNSLLTVCLRAAIKNLNGDHEEWDAFEQKIISMRQQEQEKKKLAKEKKEQQRVAIIKNNQMCLPSLDKKNDGRKKEQKPQKCVTDATQQKPDLPLDQEGPFAHLFSSPSPQEEKAEKKKRHEEATVQRDVQRNQPTFLALEEPKVQTAPPSIVLDSNPLIHDLYLLTGVAKNVDMEIENNTWDFTRENLMMYFEALGCVATDGGKHKKVSLPKAVIVSYEGSVITILNELGGALTLPRWDGSEGNGQVPPYLRKQILKAREKLVLLRVKVKNMTNSTLD